MLEVKNLSVKVGSKLIIRDISFKIGQGQILVLFGPNGSGKSTLIKTILGLRGYDIVSGEIIFNGKSLNDLAIEQRVKQGIGIMHQHPPVITGVKLKQVANFLTKDENNIMALADKLSLTEHLNRDINLGFSGGERKRSELFQILLQQPELLLLDEPESGVDLENISLMGKVVDQYLSQENKSALIITHSGYILDYVKAQRGCMIMDGSLWCRGDPKNIFSRIKEGGYRYCKECHE